MAKATTTIRQVLNYEPEYAVWFAANQSLFNQIASFYFEVIQTHEKILDLANMEALTVLEKFTHTIEKNPHLIRGHYRELVINIVKPFTVWMAIVIK